MSSPEPKVTDGDENIERVWSALLAAARRARRAENPEDGSAYGVDSSGYLYPVSSDDHRALLVWRTPSGWVHSPSAPPSSHSLLDLYLPICGASRESTLTVGHLGQGLDGYIATRSGDSNYVTGPENILHLHRMRALCDAVLVGTETVATDDPQLTTRRAEGENPVRVILDPQLRLAPKLRVFSDQQAPTLLVCDEAQTVNASKRIAAADVLGIPMKAGRLDLKSLLEALHARGLVLIFVEGGGATVSGFLEVGLLDRLQIAVAPLITGVGRPGIRLAAKQRIDECLHPTHRIFSMGGDVLFDCDLRGEPEPHATKDSVGGLSRII